MTPERDLLAQLAEWRSGRATKSMGQAFMDGYVVVFSIVVLTAMVGNVIWQSQLSTAQCATDSCLVARTLVPRVVWAGTMAGVLGVAALFGPVVASAAEGFWLLSAPVRRGRILARRLYGVIAATLGVGLVVGFVVPLLSGAGLWGSVLWSVATGLSAAALMAAAAAEQGHNRDRRVAWLRRILTAVTVALALLLVADAAGWLGFQPDTGARDAQALVSAGIALVALPVLVVIARRRLDRIRRTRLTSGGALVSSLSGAMFAMDLGLIRDIVVARRAQAVGSVRPRRGGPGGAAQLVWREWRLMVRNWSRFLTLAGTVVVPWALVSLGLGVLAVPLSGLALMVALIPTCQGLRVLNRTPGLARMIPLSVPRQRAVMLTVPTMLALLWGTLALPAFLGVAGPVAWSAPTAVLAVFVTVLAGVLGAARWTLSRPIDWSAPMLASPAGAVPTGMAGNLMRGVDFVLLITVWMVFGLSPVVSLVVAGVCVVVTVGWLDVDRLRAAEERQKKLAEAARQEAQRTRRRKRR